MLLSLPVIRVYLALEVGAFILHASGCEDGFALLVFLDDGEALPVGPNYAHRDPLLGGLTREASCDDDDDGEGEKSVNG